MYNGSDHGLIGYVESVYQRVMRYMVAAAIEAELGGRER